MASTRVLLKQSVPDPAPPQRPYVTSFRHPGYNSPHDVLFKLPRLDATPTSTQRGVHHRTALLACQIIANNSFVSLTSLPFQMLGHKCGLTHASY
ncbi:hypothetical protein F5883DRAFT_578344, partial [Diaporthe sp. PMI_573]